MSSRYLELAQTLDLMRATIGYLRLAPCDGAPTLLDALVRASCDDVCTQHGGLVIASFEADSIVLGISEEEPDEVAMVIFQSGRPPAIFASNVVDMVLIFGNLYDLWYRHDVAGTNTRDSMWSECHEVFDHFGCPYPEGSPWFYLAHTMLGE